MATNSQSSRNQHYSINGLEVVHGTGLEVAYDSSPEVISQHLYEAKGKYSYRRKIGKFWRIQIYGVSVLWGVLGVTIFIARIVIGAVVVSTLVRKAEPPQAAIPSSSQLSVVGSSTRATSTSASSLAIIPSTMSITTASNFPLATLAAASSVEPMQTTSAGLNESSATNLQVT
ncbi:hypothetical protein F5884DRAFT_749706 [Xylogone sp. PMI_703]|nr:hypothetical protein F5884DRAFT_749706 [Xylogone sp. PMI_703]